MSQMTEQIKLRCGTAVSEQLLLDMICDCETELRTYLNYDETEELPRSCMPVVKQMVLIRINQDGTEGIQSENHSGVSTSYLADLPPALKRQIRHHRRLPGR